MSFSFDFAIAKVIFDEWENSEDGHGYGAFGIFKAAATCDSVCCPLLAGNLNKILNLTHRVNSRATLSPSA